MGHVRPAGAGVPLGGRGRGEVERYGLVDACSPLLAEGQVKLYSVDSVAGQAMVAKEGPAGHRLWLLSQFQECVRWEVVLAIHADLGGQDIEVIAAGASIGAFNAVAVLCRYPDVFPAAIGMSGSYRIERFYDEAWTQDLYFSAPLQFLPAWTARNWTGCGSGSPCSPRARRLGGHRRVLADGRGARRKGIPNRVDNWGPDYEHDWPTWRQMLPQYLRELT